MKLSALTTRQSADTLALTSQVHYHLSEIRRVLRKQMGTDINNMAITYLLSCHQTEHTNLINQANLATTAVVNTADCVTLITEHSIYIVLSLNLLNSPECCLALKALRPIKPIDSCVVTIDLHELAPYLQTPEDFNPKGWPLWTALNNLLNISPTAVPTYCVISQFNSLPGFYEFFSDYNDQQLDQAWGIIIPEKAASLALDATFTTRFKNFLQRLHHQQIPRLQASQSGDDKLKINEFPVLLEQCQPLLSKLVSCFGQSAQQFLRGLFFTSHGENQPLEQPITATVARDYALTTVTTTSACDNRVYFIHDLFHKILPNDFTGSLHQQAYIQRRSRIKHYALLGTCALTLSGIAFIGAHYLSARDFLDTRVTNLITFKQNLDATDQVHITDQIKQLVTLLDKRTDLDSHNAPLLARYPVNQSNRVLSASQKILAKKLHDKFLPLLLQTLKNDLTNQQRNPAQRFYSLKLYLMFGDPKRLDAQALAQYLAPEKAATQNLAVLLTHMAPAFKSDLLDWSLINATREQLTSYPLEYLSYAWLEQLANKPPKKIISNTFGELEIPYLYTHTARTQLSKSLPKITQTIAQSHWVLDLAKPLDPKPLEFKTLQLYHQAYQNFWQLFTRRLQPNPITNLEQATGLFRDLSVQNSSIHQVINLLKTNVQSKINPHSLSGLPALFTALHRTFSAIERADNPQQALFDFTRARFAKPSHTDALRSLFITAQQYPQPVSQWLQQIAVQTWHLALENTKIYLNQQWTQALYQPFNQTLQGRYPLDRAARADISYQDFDRFFGPQGLYQKFFKHHLQAFLDLEQSDWKLKSVDGEHLSIPQALMTQLERANVIQHMFYPTDGQLTFTLSANYVSDSIRSILFNIQNQKKLDYIGSNKDTIFTWPLNQKSKAVVAAYDDEGAAEILNYTGPWAVFKLLDKAQIKPSTDTQHYELNFAFKLGEAQYTLATNKPLNPFIPGVLDQFELPEKLVS